jgi:hypothetical protein
MATKTEGQHTAEFIASEGNGTQSRNTATLILGQNLPAGSVLGKITASGKWTMVAPAAGDGSQTAAAVLFDNVDATSADKVCVIIVSPSEVNDKELNWASLSGGQKTTARAQLDAVGIRVRL